MLTQVLQAGLVGSETLRDLVENCVKGKNFTIDKDKVVPVSGINGSAEETLGQVSNTSKQQWH